MRRYLLPVAVLALSTACGRHSEASHAMSESGMASDSDRAMQGGSLPSGYLAMTDKANANIADARYSGSSGRWEVQTGPAHIIYRLADTARGQFGVTTTIDQLEAPRHPEAYGLFIGGHDLSDRAKEGYTYFLVRGTGEYLVKVRNGASTKTVVDWTPSAAIPKPDASGKQQYTLLVHVAADTVHFAVNGTTVAAVPKSAVTTDGVFGARINHNLHVALTAPALSH